MSGIEKIKEKRFNKVKERQVRKLNNLIHKEEGGITWQSSQVFPATRAFPWVNNRQVTLAIRASQATNNSQAGRLTPRASHQASQEDSTLHQSIIYQAGNPQGLWADGTPSQARSAISQAGSSQSPQAGSSQLSPGDSALPQSDLSKVGSFQASPVDSTHSPAESAFSQPGSPQSSQAGSSQLSPGDSTLPQSNLSQAGISQASPVDSTLSQAESELSQGSSSQSSPEDSALPQSNLSQAGNSQASLGDSTFSPVASEFSQASSSPSSLEDSALLAESAVPPQTVRCSARLRARQAGTTPREDSMVSQPDSTVPQGVSPPGQCFPRSKVLPQ